MKSRDRRTNQHSRFVAVVPAPTSGLDFIPPAVGRNAEKPSVPGDIKDIILKLLARHNIASKEWVYSQYDHEVQVRTMIKQGMDAGELRIIDETQGHALSCGCNPAHVEADPTTAGPEQL